jgi:8-oxo-dGTP pyrophosphatase MutT (NUDIX family)
VNEQRFRQVVPRPPEARRVEAPLDGLEVVDPGAQLSIRAVREAFALVPGDDSGDLGNVTAAVLIAVVPALYPALPAGVVLIRRASHLRANPGEIAFPGGGIDPGEAPLAAALREAEEEVALDPGSVEVLGRLSTLGRPRTAAAIVAFVGAAPAEVVLEANLDEVDEVLEVRLDELVAPGRYWQEMWPDWGGEARTMHFFELGEDLIWGATAHMLYTFILRVLKRRETPYGK